MKRTVLSLVAVLSLASPAVTLAQGMSPMPGMATPASAKTGRGVGVVKAVDSRAGNVTVQHGPIPGLGWPAMTMTFKARPPTMLARLKVGQSIRFDVRTWGAAAEITAVHPR